jgi:hypothetical protein
MFTAILAAAAINFAPTTMTKSTSYMNPVVIYGPTKLYANQTTEDFAVSIYPSGCLIGIRYRGLKTMHCLMSKNGFYPDSERGYAALEFNDVPLPNSAVAPASPLP